MQLAAPLAVTGQLAVDYNRPALMFSR